MTADETPTILLRLGADARAATAAFRRLKTAIDAELETLTSVGGLMLMDYLHDLVGDATDAAFDAEPDAVIAAGGAAC